MSVALLELAESALGELANQVVFLGGATVGLWITDPAAPPFRPTDDVDVVVAVLTRGEFDEFQANLRRAGFYEDQESGVICRWRHRDSGLVLDAMPARANILGFENRWQAAAIPHAIEYRLPSGPTIRVAPPVYLLAMKLEAFKGRGGKDFLGSRDFDDIISLIDGRPELLDEFDSADAAVREYITEETRRLLAEPRLRDGIAGVMRGDVGSEARIEAVILPTLSTFAGET